MLTKTSLQIKDIPFVTFCTGMHTRVIDGGLDAVQFGLLQPMDHTAPEGAQHRFCDTNLHRRLELKVSDVDVIHHLNKLALTLTKEQCGDQHRL